MLIFFLSLWSCRLETAPGEGSGSHHPARPTAAPSPGVPPEPPPGAPPVPGPHSHTHTHTHTSTQLHQDDGNNNFAVFLFFFFFFVPGSFKKKTPQKKKPQKKKQPNKKTFCSVLSEQSARSPSNSFLFVCFLKRENSAVIFGNTLSRP